MLDTGNANDHDALLTGLSLLLRARNTAQVNESIPAFLELAATGLEVDQAALFLLRHEPSGVSLETLCSSGLNEQQLRAVENGCTTDKGLSDVRALMQAHAGKGPADHTFEPMRHNNPFVICAPVRDPILNVLSAILYLQKEGYVDDRRNALISRWVETYTLALGDILYLGFPGNIHGDKPEKQNKITLPANIQGPEIVGDSVETQTLREQLHEIYVPAASAPDPDPILILGEKGTGKDLVARYIYAYSGRRNQAYVAVNCAEITEELAAARFFGHKKGSFTGSLANEPGFFRAADRGVLFLDEIADLSLRAQGTLLRVLENRTVVPLGETREQRVDVQVILGTNCDTEKAVKEGQIRADLLDRFKTQHIRLLPLRERPWDIPGLVRHFIAFHEKRTQKHIRGLHPDVVKMMVGYSWPGNVRELARTCSLLITHTKAGELIDKDAFCRLLPHIAKDGCNPKADALLMGEVPMRDALEKFGRELILARLRQYNWDVKSARESLGLPKTTFHRYTRALGIAGIQPDGAAGTNGVMASFV